jgi:hypothetical protein
VSFPVRAEDRLDHVLIVFERDAGRDQSWHLEEFPITRVAGATERFHHRRIIQGLARVLRAVRLEPRADDGLDAVMRQPPMVLEDLA